MSAHAQATRTIERAWVAPFPSKQANAEMAADLNFAVFVFISRGLGGNKTAKFFTKHSS